MSAEMIERSLISSERIELWQHIFDTQHAGIIIHVNSIIRDINATAIKMLGGNSPDDFLGKPFHETIIHPDYLEIIKERTHQLHFCVQSLPPLDIRLKRLDGASIDVLISATSWTKGEDHIIESMFMDITQLKRHQRLLKAISELVTLTALGKPLDSLERLMAQLFQIIHMLYSEPHNCGYLSPSLAEGFQIFAHQTAIRNNQLCLLSYAPLSIAEKHEILEFGGSLFSKGSNKSWSGTDNNAPCFLEFSEPSKKGGKAIFEPFSIDGSIAGYFFWIFSSDAIPLFLESDRERRAMLLLSISTALKAFSAKEESVRRSSELAILYKASLEIGKMNSLQEIADAVLEILDKEKGWHSAVIRFKSRTADILETTAYRPATNITEEELRKNVQKMNDLIHRPGQGMTGYVIEHGEPIRSLDLPSDPRYIETEPGICFGIYAPIPIEGKIEGAIGVESADYAFSDSDLAFLSSLGELTGMAIRSVRLIEVLRERVRWLEILHEINLQVGIEAKPEELYEILINRAIKATGAESGALLIYDAEQKVLKSHAAQGWLENITREPFAISDGITGMVFRTGQTRISPHIEDDPLLLPRSRAFVPAGRANIAVPVKAGGMVIGVFHLAMKASASFTSEFIDLVEMFGSYAGIIIRRMQLIDAERIARSEMQKAYDETLEGWARAIGLRDDETLKHTSRVVKIALAIGKAMHLDIQALEDLRRGGLLHDIGKIGIPDSILRKPGSLSKEEQQIMQTHASFANELLKPIKFLERAIVIPYSHHERWDGTGYPQRLKGEEIPLLARIFAVADVYDAMTSDRPYRSAHAKDEALNYIREQAGKHFDPKVVNAFLAVIDTIDAQPDEL